MRRPPVARRRVQDVGRARRALARAPARAALVFGAEQGARGDVGALVDVLGEALGRAAGRRGERGAAVAALLQAYVAPGRADHVQFHPCGREGLAALHGAGPAVVEGHEFGFAAIDGDGLELGAAVVGVVAPEGEGLCRAAVCEEDPGSAASGRAGLEEGFERAGDPGGCGVGLGWGGEDGADGGGESEAEGEDRFERSGR